METKHKHKSKWTFPRHPEWNTISPNTGRNTATKLFHLSRCKKQTSATRSGKISPDILGCGPDESEPKNAHRRTKNHKEPANNQNRLSTKNKCVGAVGPNQISVNPKVLGV